MNGSVVIGIGNPYRHDDGVGLAVIRRVAGEVPQGTDVAEELGEPAALVERWTGRDVAIVVDAAVAGDAAGTIHRLILGRRPGEPETWRNPPPRTGRSSHALGIDDAVALGRALGRLPVRLVILGIEAADMSAGVGLSSPVMDAIEPAVRMILRELPGPARQRQEATADVR